MTTSGPGADGGGFGGPEACRVVGITYRRLDHWARTGLVTPSVRPARGSGTQRRYSFADLVELRTIRQLLDAGVGLAQVRRAIEAVRSRGMRLSETTLVSDGRTIYACDSADDVVDVLRKGQAVFAVAVDAVVEQLRGKLEELPALGPFALARARPCPVSASAACRLIAPRPLPRSEAAGADGLTQTEISSRVFARNRSQAQLPPRWPGSVAGDRRAGADAARGPMMVPA